MYERYLKYKHRDRLNVNGQEHMNYANSRHEKAGAVMLMSDKAGAKIESTVR